MRWRNRERWVKSDLFQLTEIIRESLIAMNKGGTMPTDDEIDDIFTYHPPTDEQVGKLTALRVSAKTFAHDITTLVPESAYRTVAFRHLHELNMLLNAAIVLNGRSLR